MKRHEIWIAAGGPGYAGKPRPVVILQDHRIAELASVTTCGFTSAQSDAGDLRPLVRARADNGLQVDSRIMVDKIMTVASSNLSRRIGALSSADSALLDRAILLFLGFSA